MADDLHPSKRRLNALQTIRRLIHKETKEDTISSGAVAFGSTQTGGSGTVPEGELGVTGSTYIGVTEPTDSNFVVALNLESAGTPGAGKVFTWNSANNYTWNTFSLTHTDLSDMPDVAGTNSDHDARYALVSEADDRKVLVTATDSTPDYIGNKVYGGGDLTPSVSGAPGGPQYLTLTVPVNEHKVLVSVADTVENYLSSKITGSGSVTVTITSAGGDEKVNIAVPTIPAADDHLVLGTSADTTPDHLGDKLTCSGQAALSTLGAGGTNQKINIDVPAAEVTLTNAVTLTNKRITSRVQSVTTNANVTPDADADDCVDITAQAAGLTIANNGGTPTNFQKLMIRIKDNGGAQTIAFGTNYAAKGGIALPTTTVAGKILTLGFIYDTANALDKWILVASAQEA